MARHCMNRAPSMKSDSNNTSQHCGWPSWGMAILLLMLAGLGAGMSVRARGPDAPARPQALVAGPYLGETTPASLVIAWATDTAGSSEVHYSVDTSYAQTMTASTLLSHGKYWHQATLSGLTPATRYHYRIITDGVDLTPWPDVTAGTAPTTTATHTHFIILGDSRPESSSAAPNQSAQDVAALLAQKEADFILHTGDIVHSGGICSGADNSWEQYQRAYFGIYRESLKQTPLYPTLGNHELNKGSCGEQAYTEIFHLPANAPAGDAEKYYAFDWANVHLTVLDTELDFSPGSAQYTWLQNDLQSTNQPWKLVVFHRPAYSSGPHGSNTDVQTHLVPLFESNGVAMVFSGHDHLYERTCAIRNNACTTPDAGGVIYFVAGGAGAHLYNPTPAWFTARATATNHLMELNIENCKLTMRATDTAGNTFDSVVINRCPVSAPRVSIQKSADDVNTVLSWPHNAQNSRYELHRSDTPYFWPGPDTLLQSFEPPFDASILYTDTSAALGDSHVNHSYQVISYNTAGDSAASNRVAEFDFGDASIPVYGYQILHTYPHDDDAFTQGLVYEATDILYESTGQVGSLGSVLRKETLDGTVLKERQLNDEQGEDYFGEGITLWNNTIPQLTWQDHTGFVFDKSSFAELSQFAYPHEGWGLTHNDSYLIVSDGTSTIRFWDPTTFAEVKQIQVYDNDGPVDQLNELEYIDGEIYANVWYSDPEVIARINPYTGRVVGWINLDGLRPSGANVLNGIAYDEAGQRLFVTGKFWPWLYHIQLVSHPP